MNTHPFRALRAFALAAILAAGFASVASADPCNLTMTMSCAGPNTGATCTAVTKNVGTNHCMGEFAIGFFIEEEGDTIHITQSSNSLGLTGDESCLDSTTLGQPVGFSFCFGTASLAAGDSFTATAKVTAPAGTSEIPILGLTYVTDPATDEELGFAYAYNGLALPTCTPEASVSSIANSGAPYTVSWSPTQQPDTSYQVDESTSADFSQNVVTSTIAALSKEFTHQVSTPTTYYYRVRATNCGGGPGPYSGTVSTVVQPPPSTSTSSRGAEAVVPFGSSAPVTLKLLIPAPSGKTALDTSFTATVDKPYLTVTPSSGTIPPTGLALTVTANPATLPPGANTGTVSVTSNGTTVATVPVSVSLVTPVAGGGKTSASPDSLIIPVVTHVNSATAQFASDVRVTNAEPTTMKYQVSMTPTLTDATTSSKSTTIDILPGQTIALNDIAKNFFGFGATGASTDVGFGSLEIRPLNGGGNLTYASSRTFASTPLGTFGQFIAAVPLTKFATKAALPIPGLPPSTRTVMSLQQVAQSARFRTNLGIVEGSGTAASGRIRFLDPNGSLLKEVPYSLRAGEHQQINRVFAVNGIDNIEDGRIEITVDSPTGAVTAYASVLDNKTDDPLAVMPAFASDVSETRYVLPGMAAITGTNNFHSDIRVFNGGSSNAVATLTFYPQGGAAPVAAAPVSIAPGRVRAWDDVITTLFNRTGQGGSIVVSTDGPTSLVATGRTYTIDGDGTFGQFIPGVSPSEGIALGSAPLQVLQLEQSKNFRSNVGLAELSGAAAKVRVSILFPDSKTTPVIDVDLAPNEFRQLNSLIESIGGAPNTYNARVTVQVIGGSGRVAAYGSVIDNATKDPTYVPAQ